MSVNKWKDSNIYGNFKNKDLLTSASNTTVVTPASAEFDGPVVVNGVFLTYGANNILQGSLYASNAEIGDSLTVNGNFHTLGADNVFEGSIFANSIQSTMLEIISNGKIRTLNQTSAPNYGNLLGMSYEQIMSSSVTLTTNTVYSFSSISFSSGEYGMYQLNALVYIKSDTTSSDTTNLTSYNIYVDGCSVVPRNTGACNISTTGTKNIVIISCPISMTLSLYADTTITLKVNCTFTKTGSGTINIGPSSYIQLTKIA